MIVDVDTHWEATSYASDELSRSRRGATSFPGDLDMLAFGIAGDLLRSRCPADHRPTGDGAAAQPGAHGRGARWSGHPAPAARVVGRRSASAWMDRVGIDHCLVNPGGYWQQLEFLGADRAEGVHRCNDFLGEQLAGRVRSPPPVAVVDYTDLDVAVAELERARAQRRSCLLPLHRRRAARPAVCSPGHPDVGPGVVGRRPPRHDGRHPRRQHRVRLHRLGRHRLATTSAARGSAAWSGSPTPSARTPAQNLLVGDALRRRVRPSPRRSPWCSRRCGSTGCRRSCRRSSASRCRRPRWATGRGTCPGGDMLRRNVRSTPLPGFGDTDALDVLRELPGVVRVVVGLPPPGGQRRPDRAVPAPRSTTSTASCARGSWAATSRSASPAWATRSDREPPERRPSRLPNGATPRR